MKIGIIREGKTPPDARVALTPDQCLYIARNFDIDIAVQPSDVRCYRDEEYRTAGVPMHPKLDDRDVLLGIKEVPIEQLIPNKTYFFFSHTIKKQAYNRKLLQAILEKNIRLIDYEVLTDDQGRRLIAFGRFAGMVGAHNALYTYGKRTGEFELKRMKDFFDYAEAQRFYKTIQFPPVKIVLTGTGRVGNGAAEVLRDMGIREVSATALLEQTFDEAVFAQLNSSDYVRHKQNKPFDLRDFFKNPTDYEGTFKPFYQLGDIFINGIYWDNRAPVFFTNADMRRDDFHIKVIADVTCDIAPVSSIPATLRASTIADPIFGYNPETQQETEPHQPHVVDMMTIDNLPSELPRDASRAFGEQFIRAILPELLKENSAVIERATIATNGRLTERYAYLQDFVNER